VAARLQVVEAEQRAETSAVDAHQAWQALMAAHAQQAHTGSDQQPVAASASPFQSAAGGGNSGIPAIPPLPLELLGDDRDQAKPSPRKHHNSLHDAPAAAAASPKQAGKHHHLMEAAVASAVGSPRSMGHSSRALKPNPLKLPGGSAGSAGVTAHRVDSLALSSPASVTGGDV
jgi:hypothetical protein